MNIFFLFLSLFFSSSLPNADLLSLFWAGLSVVCALFGVCAIRTEFVIQTHLQRIAKRFIKITHTLAQIRHAHNHL